MSRAPRVALGAGVLGLGVALAVATHFLPPAAGYATVGPSAFPAIVAAGLVVCGALLLLEALRAASVASHAPLAMRGLGWVAGGLAAQIVLVGVVGFVIASSVLFVAVARGFGSRRLARDTLVGLVLATLLYLLFTEVLGLALGPRWGMGA